MSTPQISETAGVGSDPDLRFTQSGKAVANVRLAFSDSRFDEQTRQWETLRVLWVDATAWESTAERLAEQVQKGTQIWVKGNLQTQEWKDKQTGEKRSKTNLTIQAFRVLASNRDSAPQGETAPPQSAGGFGYPQQSSGGWGGAPSSGGWDTPSGPAPF